MSKEKQCNDSQNTAIGMCVDGTTAKEHKAAKVNGLQSGNSSKPTKNGNK